MKKSILMLLSLFMLGACSLVSDDALFLEEVAGKTITVEGTSYSFSSDGTVLHSSALTFEFKSTSSYTVAEYTTVLGGVSHSITVTIVDNMISVSEIETPLFLLAVSGHTIEIGLYDYTFSADGQTITYNYSGKHYYGLDTVTNSTVATYTNDSYTYIISIDSDDKISAVLSSSAKDEAFLDLIKGLEDEYLIDDYYSISSDGKTIYTANSDHQAVYFKFVSAKNVDDESETGTATYEAMVDGVHLTDITVEVDSDTVSITDYGYTVVGDDKGKANFLKYAFLEQVKTKTVGDNYQFSLSGETLNNNDYGFKSATTAYNATYTNSGDTAGLEVTITGTKIDIEPTSSSSQGS